MRCLCKVSSPLKLLTFLPTTALQRLVKWVVVLCHVLPSRAGGVVSPRLLRGYRGRIACAARGRKRRKSRAATGPPQGRGCGFPPRPFRRRGPEAASP